MIGLQTDEQILQNKKYMLERQFEHMMGNLELDFSSVINSVREIIERTHDRIRGKTPEIEQQTIETCIENFHRRFDLTKEEFDENFEFSPTVAYNEHAMEAFNVIRTILGVKVFLDQLIKDINELPFSETTEHSNKYFNEAFDYEAEEKAKAAASEEARMLEEAAQVLLAEERAAFAQEQSGSQQPENSDSAVV